MTTQVTHESEELAYLYPCHRRPFQPDTSIPGCPLLPRLERVCVGGGSKIDISDYEGLSYTDTQVEILDHT